MRKTLKIALPILVCVVGIAWTVCASIAVYAGYMGAWNAVWTAGVLLGAIVTLLGGGCLAVAMTYDRPDEVLIFKGGLGSVKIEGSAVRKCVRRAVAGVKGVRCKKVSLATLDSGEVSIKVTLKTFGKEPVNSLLAEVKSSIDASLLDAIGIVVYNIGFLVTGVGKSDKNRVKAPEIEIKDAQAEDFDGLEDDLRTAEVFEEIAEMEGENEE